MVTALRLDTAMESELTRIKAVLIKINSMMVVITAKLFARRFDHMHISKQTEAHELDPRRRLPPAPALFMTGTVYEEYERLMKKGRKNTKQKKSRAELEPQIGPAEEDEPPIGPQDELGRIELVEDREDEG